MYCFLGSPALPNPQCVPVPRARRDTALPPASAAGPAPPAPLCLGRKSAPCLQLGTRGPPSASLSPRVPGPGSQGRCPQHCLPGGGSSRTSESHAPRARSVPRVRSWIRDQRALQRRGPSRDSMAGCRGRGGAGSWPVLQELAGLAAAMAEAGTAGRDEWRAHAFHLGVGALGLASCSLASLPLTCPPGAGAAALSACGCSSLRWARLSLGGLWLLPAGAWFPNPLRASPSCPPPPALHQPALL